MKIQHFAMSCLTTLLVLSLPAQAEDERSAIKLSVKGGMVEGMGQVVIFKNGNNCSDAISMPLQTLKSGKLTPKVGESITFAIETPSHILEKISEVEQKLFVCREILTVTANQDRYRIELNAKNERCEVRVNSVKIDELPTDIATDVVVRKQISSEKGKPACAEIEMTDSAISAEPTQ